MAGKKGRRKQAHVKTGFSSPSPRPPPPPPPLQAPSGDSEAVPSSVEAAAADGASAKLCRHVEKGVDLDKLSSQISKARFSAGHCEDCAKDAKAAAGRKGRNRSNGRKEGAVNGNREGYLQKKWLCLACGHVACGGISNGSPCEQGAVEDCEKDGVVPTGHVFKHARFSRHPLALQTTDNLVWCFVCNMAVKCVVSSGSPNGNSHHTCVCPLHSAQQVVEQKLMKRTGFLKDPGKEVHAGDDVQSNTIRIDHSDVFDSSSSIGPNLTGIRRKRAIRGLMNLGNTCFFNSVMQNLLALDMLRDYFSQDLPSLEGPLSSSLRKLYLETNLDGDEQFCTSASEPSGHESGLKKGMKGRVPSDKSGSACNPRALFGAICAKVPRFRGFQQQDSHELLRCLLDGLTSEECSARSKLARTEDTTKGKIDLPDCQSQKQTGVNIIAVPSSAEKDCQQSEHKTSINGTSTTVVDKFFGGQLCSTVRCCECGHSSVVFETMLDLSLPIPNPRKCETSTSRSKVSSHGGRSRQKSHKQTKVLPNTSLNNVSNGSGPSVVDANKRSLHGGQSAQALLTSSTSQGTPSPSAHAMVDNDFSWLDFIGGGLPVESSESGSCVAKPGVECGESSFTVDFRNPSSLVESLGSSPSTVGVEGESFQNGNGSAVLNSEAHNNKPLTEKAEASPSLDSKEEGFEKPLALSEGEEDGPLPMVSGIVLLPYEPLEVSRTSSTVLESASKLGAEAIPSPSPELDGGYLDGFSQLFEEEETCFVVNCEQSQYNNDNSCVDRSWEADTAVYGPASLTVADVEDADFTISLEGCLSDFTKPELLYGENAWECESCMQRMQKKTSSVAFENYVNGGDRHEELSCICQDDCLDYDSLTVNGNRIPREVLSKVFEVTVGGESNKLKGCTPVHKIVDRTNDDEENFDSSWSNLAEGQDIVSQSSSCRMDGNSAEVRTRREDLGSAVPCNGFATSLRPSDFNCCIEETGNNGCRSGKGSVHGENVLILRDKLTSEAESNISSRQRSEKLVKTDATKRLSISKAPPILTVHLKRFGEDTRGRLSKLSVHVTFPEILDLRPFLDPRYLDSSTCFYQLVGVVEHSGTMRGGHYIAYVRSPSPKETADGTEQNGNDVWYYISDSSVHKSTLQAVLNSEAYLLFYEKRDI